MCVECWARNHTGSGVVTARHISAAAPRSSRASASRAMAVASGCSTPRRPARDELEPPPTGAAPWERSAITSAAAASASDARAPRAAVQNLCKAFQHGFSQKQSAA